MTSDPDSRPAAERSARIDAAMDAVWAEFQVDAAWRGNVRDLIDRDDATWRSCCGGCCDPCVFALANVVDAVRARLVEDV